MRANEVGELRQAIDGDAAPLHDGRWGKATMEVMLALMESASSRREILLRHQVPAARSSSAVAATRQGVPHRLASVLTGDVCDQLVLPARNLSR